MSLFDPVPQTRRELIRNAAGLVSALAFPRALQAQLDLHTHSERPYLDLAKKAERWIRSTRIRTDRGVTWPVDPSQPGSVQQNLYSGTPGIVLFLLEMYQSTGDVAYLREARAGADELLAGREKTGASSEAGLYTGLAGIAFVVGLTHRVSREPRYKRATEGMDRRLLATAKPKGAGVEWNESADIISGSAGIGLYLLDVHHREKNKDALATAAKAGLRLIERAEPAPGGLKWGIAPSVTNRYPNFSHGTAGASYFLASLYQATKDERFLKAAMAGTQYLLGVADTTGGGYKVFHHEPGGEDLFYLSWCHGPPGTARLFQRLSEVTGEQRWTNLVHRSARSLVESGIPESRTPGFWNNISQCCGNAGVAEFFLALHRMTPNPEYRAMAQRCVDDILRRASDEAGTLRWVQAEHRVRPELLIAQTGYMQGAAGVGSLLLKMDASNAGRRSMTRWPDSPFS